MVSRRSSKSRRKKTQKKRISKPNRWNWLTRGVEVLMLFFSLFWAIEATAMAAAEDDDKGSPVDRSPAFKSRTDSKARDQRAPAAYSLRDLRDLVPRYPMLSFSHSVDDSHSQQSKSLLLSSTLLDSTLFLAPEAAFMGNSLSLSFKGASFYVPSSFSLLKF